MKPNLPQTQSVQELATFWDTHDVTDFDDELVEVTESVFEDESSAVLEVRLRLQEAQRIEKVAALQGVSREILVRQWILERLEAQTAS